MVKADAIFDFSIKELDDLNTPISTSLSQSLVKRLNERREIQSDAMNYLHYRKLPKELDSFLFTDVPSRKSLQKFFVETIKRLMRLSNATIEDENLADSPSPCKKPRFDSFESKLNELLHKNCEPVGAEKVSEKESSNSLLKIIKSEMELFENKNDEGVHLSLIYDWLKNIKPTSVEAERVFSSSGYICNKVRSRLNDETLSNICFLKSYFLQLDD